MPQIENFPTQLFEAKDVRNIDHYAINVLGISGYELMSKAGRMMFHSIMKRWPETKQLLILCGGGNNGGDGYIVASLAVRHSVSVSVYYLSPPDQLTGDAKTAYLDCKAQKVTINAYEHIAKHGNLEPNTVIVDAMLGTGLSSNVREPYIDAIKFCNGASANIAAVDIPSGLCATTGAILGDAVKAQLTCTFIGLKTGLLTGAGQAHTGELQFSDLGLPSEAYRQNKPVARLIQRKQIAQNLKPRLRDSHKGDFGHVLLIGGNTGFGGAISLAAQACARMGAGLTRVATRPEHCSALLTRCPEVMTQAVCHGNELLPIAKKATVIVIGPGLGQDAWAEQLLTVALQTNVTCILDADALNLLATGKLDHIWARRQAKSILTPHPGEAARLLRTNTPQINHDRISAVRKLGEKYRCHTLLKGSGSLIACPNQDEVALCAYGNPGMASGGMGDVLSGILGGLTAQEWPIETALELGVLLHAFAADLASKEGGERGLLASDLIVHAREQLNNMCDR